MKRWRGFATAALAAAACLLLTGGAAARAHTFTDVIDDSGAPDIRTVAIQADPVSGTVSVSVTADRMFAIDRGWEPDMSVWLDTDGDGATGSASGCEYGLKFWRSPSGRTWQILRFDANEAKWEVSPKSPTATFSTDGDALTWRFATADIGGATAFQFWVAAAIYEDRRISAEDVAPDTGRWTSDLAGTPATFRDRGHDAAAPDITTIAISTAKSGVTSFSVTARGLSAISRTLRPDIDVYLDTDRNQSTGSFGADYRFHFGALPRGTIWRIDRWDARTKAWRMRPRAATAFSRRGDVVTWRFGRADLGNPKAFGFSLATAIYVSGGAIEDFAPGYGWWTYSLPSA